MTDSQLKQLGEALAAVFGGSKIMPDDEERSIYVEVRRATVRIVEDVMEEDSILGTRNVPCWAVGVVDDYGDFEMVTQALTVWDVAGQASALLARQIVANMHFAAWAAEARSSERQYE